VAEVAHRRFDEGQTPTISVLLLGAFDGAELQMGHPTSFVGRYAGADQLVDVQLEMAGEFGVEITVAAATARHPEDSYDKRA